MSAGGRPSTGGKRASTGGKGLKSKAPRQSTGSVSGGMSSPLSLAWAAMHAEEARHHSLYKDMVADDDMSCRSKAPSTLQARHRRSARDQEVPEIHRSVDSQAPFLKTGTLPGTVQLARGSASGQY